MNWQDTPERYGLQDTSGLGSPLSESYYNAVPEGPERDAFPFRFLDSFGEYVMDVTPFTIPHSLFRALESAYDLDWENLRGHAYRGAIVPNWAASVWHPGWDSPLFLWGDCGKNQDGLEFFTAYSFLGSPVQFV